MLFVVRYAMAPGAASRVGEVYPRHRAYLDEVARDGQILLIGPRLPAPGSGSLAVFRTAAAAAAFVAGDPFVLEGLALPGAVEEWAALEFVEPTSD